MIRCYTKGVDAVKVNLVVAARDVRLDESTNDLDILGVVSEAVPRALPGFLPALNIILFCEADVTEVGQERLIEISLVYADGELQARWYDTHTIPPPRRPGERSFFAPIFPLPGVPFTKPGNYAFAVNVDGDHKNALPFYVHPPETNES
jgi:hypothetical protein